MGNSYTFSDLLKQDVEFITEDKENYYVRIRATEYYDDNMWVVNKKTQKANYLGWIEYAIIRGIHDRATPVDPDILRKRVS